MPAKNPKLTRVPAMKVPDELRFAINSAARRLGQLSHILDIEIPEILRDASRAGQGWEAGIPRVQQESIPNVESDIRSFLWELVHAFDLLMQHINQNLGLGLAEHGVTWGSLDSAATRLNVSSAELSALRSLNGTPWFEELKEYRNFSHRGQLMLIPDVGENGVNGSKLEPMVPGVKHPYDVPKQLLGYLTETQNFMNGLSFWP
jgi:hypothetical protein